MSTALVLAADGRREGGRWRRGSVGIGESATTDGWQHRLKEAGIVLDYAPDLAHPVRDGETTLSAAYEQADRVRRSADAEQVADRERKRREREAEKAAAEQDERHLADLTAAQSKYVALIHSGTMTPAAAWAAHLADTRKERQASDDIERGQRDTVTRIAECVRHLDGGADYAAIFLRDFYPQEQRFLAEGMWLTRDRIESAVEFLTTVEKGLRDDQ